MAKIFNLNKPVGFTPLQAINRLQQLKPELINQKLTYAGRLDPLAEGVLLIILDPTEKLKAQYLNLDKTYQLTIVFGVSTDTYDFLGLPSHPSRSNLEGRLSKPITNRLSRHQPSRSNLEGLLPSYIGPQVQVYPPYSSKTVKGRPLFYYARTNQLNKIKIPTRKITINSINLISINRISAISLKKHILQSIKLVKGDFRQSQIKKTWQAFFNQNSINTFSTATLKISCSSGTYMRSLANNIGQKLNIPALALNIKRLKVGKFSLKDSIPLAD